MRLLTRYGRPTRPLLWLLLFAVAGGAWLISLDPRTHFTTDVSELLPVEERDSDARLARAFLRERQARVVLIALDAPAGTPPDALASVARAFADALQASPAIASAYPLDDTAWQNTLGRQLHARRFDLLLPGWWVQQRAAYESENPPPAAIEAIATPRPDFAEWLARRAITALDAHLASPAASASVDLLPSDPLLLLVTLAERTAPLTARSSPPGTSGVAGPPIYKQVLIWAETSDAPLSEEGQQPVFDALAAAERDARAALAGLTVRHTGVARFAAAAKASTRTELKRLNGFAVVGVLAVAALLLRRIHLLLHLLPIVLFAALGAIVVTTAIFPRVHVLVFVLGSILSGVAVDYAFHLLLGRREGETYPARVRRLALPLLGGAGTTVAGFLILGLSSLPLVRQLGVYVAAGVVSGLVATLLYLACVPQLDPRARGVGVRPCPPLPSRWRVPLMAGLATLAIVGLTRVEWRDDLRTLEYPAPQLRANDAALRTEFGQAEQGATYLTRGRTYAEARQRWDVFSAAAPSEAGLAGVADLLPLPNDYALTQGPEARSALAEFARFLPLAAAAAEYEATAFAPFLDDLAAYLASPAIDYETLIRETLADLPGPLGLLTLAEDDGVAFLGTAPMAFPVPATAEGTLSLSALESLNHLFSRHRQEALRLSLFGCAALMIIACTLHGLRLGMRTAALPLLAAALALALLALRGESLSLFHLIGAFLGVCLADDYAHFAASEGVTRTAIRLSALTSATSFGVLMASAIPAVAALGITVFLIVLLALVFVEIDLFSFRIHPEKKL